MRKNDQFLAPWVADDLETMSASDAISAEPPVDYNFDMNEAPEKGRFLAFNRMVGVYQTFRDHDFPRHRKSDGKPNGQHFPCLFWDERGNWFPCPIAWAPMPDGPSADQLRKELGSEW